MVGGIFQAIFLLAVLAWSGHMGYRLVVGLVSSVRVCRFDYGQPLQRVSLSRRPATFILAILMWIVLLAAMLVVFSMSLVGMYRTLARLWHS